MRIHYRSLVPTGMIATVLATGPVAAATGIWDLPPLRYSDSPATDSIARLINPEKKSTLPFPHSTPLETLHGILKLLDIPVSSQILVFSKTSKQNLLIRPDNPRCLFFNENSYVGYVPGGNIEIITHDPVLGPVFYLLTPDPAGTHPPEITRDKSDCLSCHATARTESVPGVLVRSVFPDTNGSPVLSHGSFLTDHSSPVAERWGGYYVTGKIAIPHMGNKTYQESATGPTPAGNTGMELTDGTVDLSRYPARTSDIVALMILEHQCKVHNLMNSVAIQHRRIQWLQKSLTPADSSTPGTASRFTDDAARRITDLLLFKDEAPLGEDGIEGDPAYQEAFTRRFPKSGDGRSLADFQLNDRIFKHRCSYMVYSSAFRSLPETIRSAVLKRLREILNGEPSPGNHPSIQPSERKKIDSILRDTLPEYAP